MLLHKQEPRSHPVCLRRALGFFVSTQLTVHFPNEKKEQNKPTTPEVLGLSIDHARWGTQKSTLFVSATSEGLPTLIEGQAPNDIDRFKAWHMEPEYHAISHVRDRARPIFGLSLEMMWQWGYVTRAMCVIRVGIPASRNVPRLQLAGVR